MSFLKKSKKKSDDDKFCFRCDKKIAGHGYTKTHGRYCCEKCCSDKQKKREVCEFC